MSAIAICDVHKRYPTAAGAVHALRGVSFALEPGTVCAIVGPSGSGKTTLLGIAGGLDAPSAGEVHVAGRPLHLMSAVQRARFRAARIGFVFQANNLIPVLTAAENVALPLALGDLSARQRATKVAAILDELGLHDVADHRPNELSGGQQQRVGIARALIAEPALVLADEPTAHLDSHTGLEVMRLLRNINRWRGTTFVFSTHDAAVESVADERIILRDGATVSPPPHEGTNGSCQSYSPSPYATFSVTHAAR